MNFAVCILCIQSDFQQCKDTKQCKYAKMGSVIFVQSLCGILTLMLTVNPLLGFEERVNHCNVSCCFFPRFGSGGLFRVLIWAGHQKCQFPLVFTIQHRGCEGKCCVCVCL